MDGCIFVQTYSWHTHRLAVLFERCWEKTELFCVFLYLNKISVDKKKRRNSLAHQGIFESGIPISPGRLKWGCILPGMLEVRP